MADPLRAEIERLRRALERISDTGCEQVCEEISDPCFNRYPGMPECWCPPCVARAALRSTEEADCPYCAHPASGHDKRPIGCREPGCICTHGPGTPEFPEPHRAFAAPSSRSTEPEGGERRRWPTHVGALGPLEAICSGCGALVTLDRSRIGFSPRCGCGTPVPPSPSPATDPERVLRDWDEALRGMADGAAPARPPECLCDLEGMKGECPVHSAAARPPENGAPE
jgi:hypothetical protein